MKQLLLILVIVLSAACQKVLYDECPPEGQSIKVRVTDLLPDSLASFEELQLRSISLLFYPINGAPPIAHRISGSEGQLSIPPGNYAVLLYSSDFFDVDAVFFQSMNSINEAEAYTRQRIVDNDLIMNEPDPLFCAFLPRFSADSPQELIEAELLPRVFTYRFKILIEGVQYISAASAKVTGMYGSVFLQSGAHRSDKVAAMYINTAITPLEPSKGYLQGEFRSFGSSQRTDVQHKLSVALTSGNSSKIIELDDLTSLIKNLPRGGEIIITQKIVITPSGGETGGGFNPGVAGWDDLEITIPI